MGDRIQRKRVKGMLGGFVAGLVVLVLMTATVFAGVVLKALFGPVGILAGVAFIVIVACMAIGSLNA